MPFPYQYQNQSGFGANSFIAASNPSPAANPMMGNYTAASRIQSGGGGGLPAGGITYPASGGGGYNPGSPSNSPIGNSLNVNAGSGSPNPFGGFGVPDLSYADPNTLNRLNISNLIYSVPAGGYIFGGRNYAGGSYPANSGGDPAANRQASNYFNYIGSLPTRQMGSPALMSLYSSGAAQGPPPGPSLNTQISSIFSNQPAFVQAAARRIGFNTNGYQGPFVYGRRNSGGY
jgi:hypothetical protein